MAQSKLGSKFDDNCVIETDPAGRRSTISANVSDTRPYLTRHLPNSYRSRILTLAEHYEVSLEEMFNCAVGHGLVALEKIVKEAEAD